MTAALETPQFRLVQWARSRPARERAAVTALLEDHVLLARPDARALILTEDPQTGAVSCDWEQLCKNRYSPVFSPADRAFLSLLLSLACHPQVHLGTALDELSECRRAVVLCAIAAAGSSHGRGFYS
jgi:hypothetical protein